MAVLDARLAGGDAELKRFYPTSVLVTGFDIIFFWVARMMMMGLHFMGEVPFRDVYIHALVRDEKGAKMSKSKGNVIDPLALIDRFGADALRFTLAAMAAQGRDIKLSESRVEGYRNFATKLWNAARFAEMNGCVRVAGFDPKAAREPLNRWILGEAAKAVAETSAAIESYRFNDAANAAYRFVWSMFCDWCLELAKPVLQSAERSPAKRETQATIAHVLDDVYRAAASLHALRHRGAVGDQGRSRDRRATSVLALGPWPGAGLAGRRGRRGGDRLGGRSRLRNSLGAFGNGRSARRPADADPGPGRRRTAPTSRAAGPRRSSASRGSATSNSPKRRRPARCRSWCAAR